MKWKETNLYIDPVFLKERKQLVRYNLQRLTPRSQPFEALQGKQKEKEIDLKLFFRPLNIAYMYIRKQQDQMLSLVGNIVLLQGTKFQKTSKTS